MIGEICAYYGWTVDYVLAMNASRFFLMLESAKKLKSIEYQRLCYVSRSSQMQHSAFEETIEYFGSLGGEKEQKSLPEKPKNAPKPLSGEAARSAVMRAFAKDTRINRAVAANPKPRGGGVNG